MFHKPDTPHLSAAAKRGLIHKKPLLILLALSLAAGSAWGISTYRPSQDKPAGADERGGPRRGAEGGPGRDRRGGPPGGDRPTPVIVAPVERQDVNSYLNGLGTVTATATVVVKPRVDGQLMKLHFTEGQLVKAGDLLAEIDPRPFQVQLKQAEGQLARDQALLNNVRQDLERYRKLVAQDSATQQQLDSQQALVGQYEAAIKIDQGSIDNARLQLSYARLTAPVSGRLGLRQVDAGNVVKASDTNGIVSITQIAPINVVFTLPESALAPVLAKFNAGELMPANALDRDRQHELATGRLTTLDNQIDIATGTIKIKAEFPNTDGHLFPNQFVNLRLKTGTQHDALVIPNTAVQRGTAGTFVYVVKDGNTASVRPVVTRSADGERTVVERGLREGEQVVTDGVDRLRDGARIEPVSRADAERASALPASEKKGRRGEGRPRGERRGGANGGPSGGPRG